jgi:hypothetical protein
MREKQTTNPKGVKTMTELQAFKKAVKGLETETDISGCQFIGVEGYTNKFGEVSNQVFNSGVDHKKVLAADRKKILTLQADAGKYGFLVQKHGNDLVARAFDELLKSADTCLAGENVRSQAQKDAYVWINGGMKYCIATGKLMIFGQKVSKTVLVPGKYPVVNSRKLTLAKNDIKQLARIKGDDYRQFIIDTEIISGVNVGGKKITFTVH